MGRRSSDEGHRGGGGDGDGGGHGRGRDRDTKVDYDEDEKISFETSRGVTSVSTFDGMGIREDLLRGLYSYGV